jgi:hypothetical protein
MSETREAAEDFLNEKFEEYGIEKHRDIDEEVIEEIIEKDDPAMANTLIFGVIENAAGGTEAWARMLDKFAITEEDKDSSNYCPNCGEEL